MIRAHGDQCYEAICTNAEFHTLTLHSLTLYFLCEFLERMKENEIEFDNLKTCKKIEIYFNNTTVSHFINIKNNFNIFFKEVFF